MGYNSLYICGTDEYGTATETKAHQEGLTPQAICDKYHKLHKDIYTWFDIDFDLFGRTTTSAHAKIASDIFLQLNKNGELKVQDTQQCYCDQCQKFLADRFVLGTCPSCSSHDARGDQCDKCGKILNPEDLQSPRCFICGSKSHLKSSQHIFLDLPNIKPRLEDWVEGHYISGKWSHNSIQTTKAWLEDGIRARCITRDLKWGIPVPLPEFHNKVMYVWFEAPIGYISITANLTDHWEKWWKAGNNVELVQFMGKDNVTFHSVMFPSTLIGTGENWNLVQNISATEFLNYEDGKFSKSRGVGVFGDEAMKTGVPVEVFRYYLLANRPEQSDSAFKWADLADKSNKELLPNLGNLLNRLLKFIEKREIELNPAPVSSRDLKVLDLVYWQVKSYVDEMEQIRLKSALKTAMDISMIGNKYLQDSQFWNLEKTDPEKLKSVLWVAVNLVRLVTLLLEPFMPSFSAKVYEQLGITRDSRESELLSEVIKAKDCSVLSKLIKPGLRVKNVKPIFREIDLKEVQSLKQKFSGKKDSASNNPS